MNTHFKLGLTCRLIHLLALLSMPLGATANRVVSWSVRFENGNP
jgi:hypothetical protein